MTVIAWDGTTLAADRCVITDGHRRSVTKIRQHHGCLAAGSGHLTSILQMHAWFMHGEDLAHYPACQTAPGDEWCEYVIVRPDRTVWRFESPPVAIPVVEETFACGAGRDYAYGAMAYGANAYRAVEIASQYNNACGGGVDFLKLPE